jgi:hypothetical protein
MGMGPTGTGNTSNRPAAVANNVTVTRSVNSITGQP